MTAWKRLVVAAAVASGGCFNSGSYTPIITAVGVQSSRTNSVDPVQTGATKILVFGSYLGPDTKIFWNGSPQPTTYIGLAPDAEAAVAPGAFFAVQVELDPSLTQLAGTATITAAGDGTLVSNPFTVTIKDAAFTAPTFSPSQIDIGAPTTTITLTGTGLSPTTSVVWEDTALQTTFVSSTQITAQVPASLLAAAGDALVTVAPDCDNSITCSQAFTTVIHVGSASETRLSVAVPGLVQDLVWDAAHAKLYFGANAFDGSGDCAISALDPTTSAIGTTAAVSSCAAIELSISDQNEFLYSDCSQAAVAERRSLPDLGNATLVARASSILPAPGAPTTVAALSDFSLGVIDGTVPRPQTATKPSEATDFGWGADASTLFLIESAFSTLHIYQVGAAGISSATTVSNFPVVAKRFHFDPATQLLCGTNASCFDAQGGVHPFSFDFAPNAFNPGCVSTTVSSNGRMYMACRENAALTIRSFDVATRHAVAKLVLELPAQAFSNDLPQPAAIVRWGTNGLAVALASTTGLAATSSIFLYTGPFVP